MIFVKQNAQLRESIISHFEDSFWTRADSHRGYRRQQFERARNRQQSSGKKKEEREERRKKERKIIGVVTVVSSLLFCFLSVTLPSSFSLGSLFVFLFLFILVLLHSFKAEGQLQMFFALKCYSGEFATSQPCADGNAISGKYQKKKKGKGKALRIFSSLIVIE